MKFWSSFFLFLILSLQGYAQFNMPSIKEVVSTFFHKYSFDNSEEFVTFQRQKQGWFVSESKYDNAEIRSNPQMFWSLEDRAYLDLQYPKSNDEENEIGSIIDQYMSQIVDEYESYQFERNKYYGYPGWAWDIINDTTNQHSLSDIELESKGRAYSNYSSGFIADQSGILFINNDIDRKPLKGNESISKSRIEKFVYYNKKAIEAYASLLKSNPQYDTKVGNIAIKLANEHLFAYLDLAMCGDTAQALEIAKKLVSLKICSVLIAQFSINYLIIAFYLLRAITTPMPLYIYKK